MQATEVPMTRYWLLVAVPACIGAAAPQTVRRSELRCGWIQNPTPANWWLVDADAEWTLGVQGGYQAPGLDVLPDLTAGDWEATNGSYGYGCGCIRGRFDAKTKRVVRVTAFRQKPIAACRADPKIGDPLD
jgi:hypothetical protein